MARFTLYILLFLFGLDLLSLMNVVPGMAGWDYSFFMPRLFDGLLAFKSQGLLPPYYSPYLCGGFPFFADPQSMFYSVPQFLSFAVDPWKAIQISAFLFLVAGGLGAYVLAKRVFLFDEMSSVLCAVLFATNGFFRSRMLIGHLTFHAFMLTPFLMLAVSWPGEKILAPSITAALILSYFIQSGGHYVTFFGLVSVVLVLALCFGMQRHGSGTAFKTTVLRTLLAMFITAGLCASKIAAALSLVRHLPRRASFDYLESAKEAAALLYAQFMDPAAAPFFSWGTWEFDTSLGAAVWPLAAFGLYILLKGAICDWKSRDGRRSVFCLLAFLAGVFFVVGMATGLPSWVHLVKKLPVIDQFRVNMRFTSALILPLSLLAGAGMAVVKQRALRTVTLGLVVLSCLISMERARYLAPDFMSFSLAEVAPFYKRVLSGEDVFLSRIGTKGGDDFSKMVQGESNPACYQTFYARPPTKKLKAGPVAAVTDGKFNLINPSCYWFPEENGCKPGTLISESDRENFEMLRTARNPRWKTGAWQRAANMLSLVAIFFTFLAQMFLFMREHWQSK